MYPHPLAAVQTPIVHPASFILLPVLEPSVVGLVGPGVHLGVAYLQWVTHQIIVSRYLVQGIQGT